MASDGSRSSRPASPAGAPAIALSFALAACGPGAAVTGQWVTVQPVACDRPGVLSLSGASTGRLELPMGCRRSCRAAVSIRPSGAGAYNLAVAIETPEICEMHGGGTRDDYRCTLTPGGTELRCDNLHRWRR